MIDIHGFKVINLRIERAALPMGIYRSGSLEIPQGDLSGEPGLEHGNGLAIARILRLDPDSFNHHFI